MYLYNNNNNNNKWISVILLYMVVIYLIAYILSIIIIVPIIFIICRFISLSLIWSIIIGWLYSVIVLCVCDRVPVYSILWLPQRSSLLPVLRGLPHWLSPNPTICQSLYINLVCVHLPHCFIPIPIYICLVHSQCVVWYCAHPVGVWLCLQCTIIDLLPFARVCMLA